MRHCGCYQGFQNGQDRTVCKVLQALAAEIRRTIPTRTTVPPRDPCATIVGGSSVLTGDFLMYDEARICRRRPRPRQWATAGTRQRSPPISAMTTAYLFGAICPVPRRRSALASSSCRPDMMQLHLDEISRNVAAGRPCRSAPRPGRSGTDRQARRPKNISRSSALPAPELNPVEKVCAVSPARLALNTVVRNYEPHRRRMRGLAKAQSLHPKRITSHRNARMVLTSVTANDLCIN